MLSIYPHSAFDVYNKIKLHFTSGIDAACEEIYTATVGAGTDEDTLIKVLGPRSPSDRALISYRYKELHEQSLSDLIKSETSGDFGYLLQMICMSLPEAEAFIIHKAAKGMGTSENLIYPIIMGRSNKELKVLKQTFHNKYDEDLAVMLSGELSGDFHKVIMQALQEQQVDFKAQFHTHSKAKEDCEMLYKAGEGKWGTDEGTFVKTLLACPPHHLKNVDKEYSQQYGHDLIAAIKSEFSGAAASALVYFVRISLEPFELIADQIEKAMAGIGTDECSLSALLVRYHLYMSDIEPIFQAKHKKTIRERVDEEASGQYRDLLMNVLEGPSAAGDYA